MAAYAQVNESKFLIPEEIPTQERTAFMGAAAAAHKAGQSHFNFGGKKHKVTMQPSTAKAIADQKESVDLDKTNADKAVAHDCATHVKHESWGYGECIAGEHTIIETSEGQGYVSHYDVMFEHGVEQNVDVKDLTVLQEMSHSHSKKKKEDVDIEMNPKKDKKGDKNTDTVAQPAAESRWPIYARIQEKYADRAKHYAKSAPPEGWDEKEKNNKGAMDMRKDMKADSPDESPYKEKDGHDDASKAGRVGPKAKGRPNDNKQGDKKVINPVSGVVTKEK